MRNRRYGSFVPALAAVTLLAGGLRPASAGPTLAPPYDSQYSLNDLGSVAGLPTPYGGVVFEAGNPNVLLIGGSANNGGGAIYSVGVTRNAQGHITGFQGAATLYATAPYIDGGLAYAPNGDLLYTAYPTNQIGEIKPGSTSPDKMVDLNSLGVTSSVGSLAIVPSGFPGAGSFKIASYNGGGFYSASLTPDGSGTYNISNVALVSNPGGGPEGIAYVPLGSPLFPSPSLLLAEYGNGTVQAFTLDSNGNLTGTGQDFITGLTGAEGAIIDPVTGDFVFSTFGGSDQVVVVQGFARTVVPEPAGVTLAAVCLGGLALRSWRRRRA
jgi:hypothetical protein